MQIFKKSMCIISSQIEWQKIQDVYTDKQFRLVSFKATKKAIFPATSSKSFKYDKWKPILIPESLFSYLIQTFVNKINTKL